MVPENKKKSEVLKPGVRSIEHFHHFRCGYCNGWWGIGDAPRARKKWHCPWCGKENEYNISTKKNNGHFFISAKFGFVRWEQILVLNRMEEGRIFCGRLRLLKNSIKKFSGVCRSQKIKRKGHIIFHLITMG